ncbi:hypothetical protein CYLTODRAFT_411707 [Cylindrobasidium torrendii FP15055 ss-10]|uniref:DUF6593 domain-containing protein n=1 Tax=Cylindrobasidium torrendii FP15055 ss-10 TaxID=1314674 RepID=A0A0D7B7X4_9AGAR|nr:hypothetical protein CYLTODRAFT_411707 [Cylindrobasidium torrendii FP15055 ss-10]
MDLFLVPDNPVNTVFVSTNGVAHYQTETPRCGINRTTVLTRPTDTDDGLVAEIAWRRYHWQHPTLVRTKLLANCRNSITGWRPLAEFLFKRSPRKTYKSRYFVADDGQEYRWKFEKNEQAVVLTRTSDNEEFARYERGLNKEGLYAGERKTRLHIRAECTIDYDLLLITFIATEQKRRDRAEFVLYQKGDQDPFGDGAGDS